MSQETYTIIRKKKKKGLELFYQRYGKKLLAYAVQRWDTDEDTAWEFVYLTFDKIAKNIKKTSFASEEKFASYVLVTFLNLLRNHFRDTSKQVRLVPEDHIERFENVVEEEEAELESVDMTLLKAELEKLEDWERMLLLMRAQKMSYPEISKFVNKPTDQLRVYYQRLKKKVMQNINAKKEVQHG
jgi:RNA polymerase sigma factor (sigma-70 family)